MKMALKIRVNIKSVCVGLVLLLTIRPIYCQEEINPIHSFSLERLSSENISICEYPSESPSGISSIHFNPEDNSIRFRMPGYDEGIPYPSAKYLVIDIEHANEASLVILLEFMRKGDTADQYGWIHSRISTQIGVLPNLQTRMIFPLSYLDAQEVFLPKVPRQLKGTLNGKRMDPREIDEICIRLKNARARSFPQSVFIQGIYLFNDMPPSLPILEKPLVDSLGQWSVKKWKDKAESFDQMKNEVVKAGGFYSAEDWPEERSEYMGLSSIRFDSTGFFHTHHDGKRWWLVDPIGCAYLSIAPTGVRAYSHGPVEGNEELFEFLPDNNGSFSKAYAVQRGLLSLSYLTVNLIRIWGIEYEKYWLSYTGNLIRSLGFTGSGNWSDAVFYKNSGLPYFYPMSGFPSTKVKLFRDFPDVFAPEYSSSVINYALQLISLKDDPLMIGYFLGNEPHWAFGEFNLAREMMYKNDQSFTRNEFINWLIVKYNEDPYMLSAAWGYDFTSFQDLRYFILPRDRDISEKAQNDLLEFSGIMVDKYAKTICDATRKADPNHLNLGLRYAWISSNACLQTGKYFDVFSLNGYKFPDPPDTQVIVDELNKPVLIGEFHFGAIDRGLPATGLIGLKTQRGRGLAYRRYVEQGFARPEIVGIHYFQWNDQPVTGRFDGENYNIGIVDVTCRPYEGMARHIKRTNFKIFKIAAGKAKPFIRTPATIPAIYY